MNAALSDGVARLALVVVLACFVLILIAECNAYGRARWHNHEQRVRHHHLMRELRSHQDDR